MFVLLLIAAGLLFLPAAVGGVLWAGACSPQRGWRTICRLDLAGLMIVMAVISGVMAMFRRLFDDSAHAEEITLPLFFILLPAALPMAWCLRMWYSDQCEDAQSLSRYKEMSADMSFLLVNQNDQRKSINIRRECLSKRPKKRRSNNRRNVGLRSAKGRSFASERQP